MEEISLSTGQKKHKIKKEKVKNIENEKRKEMHEKSTELSKQCLMPEETTHSGGGDERKIKIENGEELSFFSKHKKHKKERIQFEDNKKNRFQSSDINDLTSADDTCLVEAEHSGVSLGHRKKKKKKRKHSSENNDCDDVSGRRHRECIDLSSDLTSAADRSFCSESSGAIGSSLGESKGGKRKSVSREDESPRKRQKRKHKKDNVVKVEDQSKASGVILSEGARGDQEAAAQRHWRRGVPSLTMEEAVAMLGREMNSTTDRAYWKEITDLLDERMIPYRTGMWSRREDEILIRNWTSLTEEMNLGAEEIIYAQRTNDNSSIRKTIKTSKFYLRLTAGLNRTSYSVYIRARKLFDPKHHGLNLSEDEKLLLDELRQKLGKKWAKIGEEMGYSGQALINYVHDMNKRQVNGAPFSEEEDKAILELVRQEVGLQDVSKVYSVPWTRILSQKSILTANRRTTSQCRSRWLGELCWRHANPGKTKRKFSAADQVKLIRLIYESDAMEDNEIDFDNLMQEFEDVPSPHKLKKIWYKLTCMVPDYHWKQFTDIIEYLHDFHIPKLEYNHDLLPIIDDWSDEDG